MRVMITNAVAVHQIPFLVDVGFPYETAALLFGGMAATSSVGRFGLGVLSDRVDKRHVMAICLSLLAIAMVIMAMTTGELWQVLLYIAIYSLGYGGMTTMTTTMICEYFGRSHLATIQGLFSMVWMSGTMAGPYIAGYVFDVTHSYRLAFLFFAGASVVALAGLMAVKPPNAAARRHASIGDDAAFSLFC